MERKFEDERETRFDERGTKEDVEKLRKKDFEKLRKDEGEVSDELGPITDSRPDNRGAQANLGGAQESDLLPDDVVEIEEEEVFIVGPSETDNSEVRGNRASSAEEDAPAPSVEANAGIVLNGRYMPPPEDKDGKRWVRHTALVQAEPDELYRLWRDIEQAPKWQEQIVSVTKIGPSRSHWVMESNGKTIEWDAEILRDEPGKRIAWRSVQGDSHNAGEVVFEKAYSERGTMVTLLQEFEMGAWANILETIVGRNPKQAVIENLRHFKALAETGEIPRTYGQPHGPRGTVGKAKEAMYAEKQAPPPGHLKKAS